MPPIMASGSPSCSAAGHTFNRAVVKQLALRPLQERPAQAHHARLVAPAMNEPAVVGHIERELAHDREPVGIFSCSFNRNRIGIRIPAAGRMNQRGIDAGLIHFLEQLFGRECLDLAVQAVVGVTVFDQMCTWASMILMASRSQNSKIFHFFDVGHGYYPRRKEHGMPEFRLIQISDTHLARRFSKLTDNFHRVSEYIDAKRPDLVVNSGDMAFDAPTSPGDLEYAQSLHAALPVACRLIPGNHDVGDNPTAIGAAPTHPASEQMLRAYRALFGEDRWCFDAAGWRFIGLNTLVMNSGLADEAEQFDWLASQLSAADGKPLALFLHKPLFLNAPDDPELAASAIRYVPMPARPRLIEMLRAVDLRLVASGHVHQRRDFTYSHIRQIWAPSAGFIISDARQDVIGTKEVGLVEYRFAPDRFEVRHVRAPRQIDIDLDELLGKAAKS
jgi:hypothetical protein